jgi:hypothetical protein
MKRLAGILRVMIIVWVIPFKASFWSISKPELVVSYFIKVHLLRVSSALGDLSVSAVLAVCTLFFALVDL